MPGNALIFFGSLFLAGAAYVAFSWVGGASHLAASLWATGTLLASLVIAGVDFDALAFCKGAVATISQLLLRLNLWWAEGRDLAALLAALLVAHLTMPHVRGTPYDWRSIAAGFGRFALAAAPGWLLGSTLLSQAPDRD